MRGCFFVLLHCLMVSWAAAQIPITLEGQFGGSSQAVAVSEEGTIAYLGVGPRLLTLDISDPSNPRQIAQSEVLPEVIEDIVVRDGYAYVADGFAGLYVLDVSNAKAPYVIGRWSDPEGYTFARGCTVRLSGNYAYLADGSEGLHIIDISNPDDLRRVSGIPDVSCGTVAVSNGYAYVNSYGEGIAVFDVSNPMQPQKVPQSGPLPYPEGIVVAGSHLYVCGGLDDVRGLYILDAKDPAKLSIVGRCEIEHPGELTVDGKLAFVCNGWRGLDIIRITNPALPSRVGRYETAGYALAVAVTETCVYMATDFAGLEIVDVSVAQTPLARGTYASTNFLDVVVSGSYAYLASAYTGLQTVDISDPAAPVHVSSLDLIYTHCVALGKEHIYVGSGKTFKVIDVSNPVEPVVVASRDMGGDVVDITVIDRYAYVAAGKHLAILDTTDPCNPVPVSWCDASYYTRSVCVADGYAYVTGGGGLDVIDVSHPLAPVAMGWYNEGQGPFHAAVSGDCAYLSIVNLGLVVIDVSDPFLLGRVGQLAMRHAHDVVIRDHYAVVTDYDTGVKIIDISNPAVLVSAGECDTPGYGDSVFLAGDHAYVAAHSGGLVVLKIAWPAREDRDILDF